MNERSAARNSAAAMKSSIWWFSRGGTGPILRPSRERSEHAGEDVRDERLELSGRPVIAGHARLSAPVLERSEHVPGDLLRADDRPLCDPGEPGLREALCLHEARLDRVDANPALPELG